MRADIINPFYKSAKEILEMEIGTHCKRGELSLASSKWTTQDITVILNIIGEVRGTFLIGMSEETGKKIAEVMIGEPATVINELTVSALAELGNIIAGRALAGLETIGYIGDITPPMFLYGRRAYISTLDRRRIQIPLDSEMGLIELSVALESK